MGYGTSVASYTGPEYWTQCPMPKTYAAKLEFEEWKKEQQARIDKINKDDPTNVFGWAFKSLTK